MSHTTRRHVPDDRNPKTCYSAASNKQKDMSAVSQRKTPLMESTDQPYTGRFIMYSGITNIDYRKTVGHVFTKLVQI